MITQVYTDKIHYLPILDGYRYIANEVYPMARAGWQRNYSVRCLVEENGKQHLLQYQAALELVTEKGDSKQYSLTKSGFLLTGQVPEGAVDTINVATGSVLYPLQFTTQPSGTLGQITNYSQIIERWPAIKEGQMKRYGGELMDWYLQSMEDTLLNRQAFDQALQQDLLLFVLLLPLYGDYGPQKQKQWESAVPQLIPNYALPCQLTLQLGETLTKEKRLPLDLKGVPRPPLTEASLQELLHGEAPGSRPAASPVEVHIQGQWQLDTEHYILQESQLAMHLQSGTYSKHIQLHMATA